MKSLLPLLLLLTGDAFTEGLRAYREGRFRDALAAFTEAEKADGDGASAALFYDKALAALRSGALSEAESAAERAAARGGGEFGARRDFLLGNVAFLRCEKAEAVASGPEAEPFAWDAAIAHGEAARNHWQLAAASRLDWPEARRNVERARRKLEELAQKKLEAEKLRSERDKKQPSQPNPLPEPPVPPKPEDPSETSEPAPVPEPQRVPLSADQLERLLDRLGEKEREKIRIRRAQRRSQKVDVEKDW